MMATQTMKTIILFVAVVVVDAANDEPIQLDCSDHINGWANFVIVVVVVVEQRRPQQLQQQKMRLVVNYEQQDDVAETVDDELVGYVIAKQMHA